MSRTDRRGRDLKQFLQAEILGRDVKIEELVQACGISTARYYGRKGTCGRGDAPDFPNTEELRHVAEFYRHELGEDGYLNLLVEFDWLDERPDALGYTNPFAGRGATLTAVRPVVQRKSRREQQQETARRNPSL